MPEELFRPGYLVAKLLEVMEPLHQLKDLDAILDQVLLQARRLTGADAGSIYLIKNNLLHFGYGQNDSLFTTADANKYLYASHTLPLDNQSLAGYVALSGETLVIDDAYKIPPEMPFTFNKAFDEQSRYRTGLSCRRRCAPAGGRSSASWSSSTP